MNTTDTTFHCFVPNDEIRAAFAAAMSSMYRNEVPQYGTLLDLVANVNAAALKAAPSLVTDSIELARLEVERHGAIRLGTPYELSIMRRVFAVMGMAPVGYYDLTIAGVPVHSTAFRPVSQQALAANPFRVFTSLLRLDEVPDTELRDAAAEILWSRRIFTLRALELVERFERVGGLSDSESEEFVAEVLHTFRWHSDATVSRADYVRLHDAHRLVADVVCFKGPHINHLTPRTLDIDAAQAEMVRRGLRAKDVIEGPPRRAVPILLRQTSFKALDETVRFAGQQEGAHTARFGEIEQRGIALTRTGRALYDQLLERVLPHQDENDYPSRLSEAFHEFPDDLEEIRRKGLGFFRYSVVEGMSLESLNGVSVDDLVAEGALRATPITYEDFLPVSAAGIFQSNLGDVNQKSCQGKAAQQQFEEALGAKVLDEFTLYEAEQSASLQEALRRVQELLNLAPVNLALHKVEIHSGGV